MTINQFKNDIERLINEIGSEFDLLNSKEDIPDAAQLIQKIEQLYKKSLVYDFLIKENRLEASVRPSLPEIQNTITSISGEQNIPDERNNIVDTKQAVLDLFSENSEAKHPVPSPLVELPANTQSKQLVDIRTIIGINEKFRYINELFAGSTQEYNIVIDQLNTIYTLSAAQAYLDSLKSIYRWDNISPAVESFLNL